MRVGLVRNVALGMVALVGLGLAGCDDNPTDFESDETVRILANPTVMTVTAGGTSLLQSRTENAGNEPTWEEIDASVDGSCGSAAISVGVAASYEPTIDPPGVFDVTGGMTIGETCIQLSGGGASATVEVTVVGDSLAVTAAAEELQYAEDADGPSATTQLTATLLSEDANPVSPFDQTTDIVWTSDNEDVIVVDANGLATAVGVGSATVTGTWTDGGVSRSGSVLITVTPPATAVLTSLDVTSGPVGTYVTITGTGMVSVFDLFIDGLASPVWMDGDPTPTTASFWMPFAGSLGPHDIQIGVVGDLSNALEFTVTTTVVAGEPDSPTLPKPSGGVPFTIVDYTDAADLDDFYSFTLTEDTSIDVVLSLSGGDNDVYVTDAAFTVAFCLAASLDNPEVIENCVLEAGDYLIWVNNYTGDPVTHRLDVTFTPTED